MPAEGDGCTHQVPYAVVPVSDVLEEEANEVARQNEGVELMEAGLTTTSRGKSDSVDEEASPTATIEAHDAHVFGLSEDSPMYRKVQVLLIQSAPVIVSSFVGRLI